MKQINWYFGLRKKILLPNRVSTCEWIRNNQRRAMKRGKEVVSYACLMNPNEEEKVSMKSLRKGGDEDLVIEGNAVYEVDRRCYDRAERTERKRA